MESVTLEYPLYPGGPPKNPEFPGGKRHGGGRGGPQRAPGGFAIPGPSFFEFEKPLRNSVLQMGGKL